MDARLLLLDDVVEVLRPVRPAQERRDPDDGQAADVHGHLLHAARFVRARERHRGAEELRPSEVLERRPVLADGLHDLEGRRLLG